VDWIPRSGGAILSPKPNSEESRSSATRQVDTQRLSTQQVHGTQRFNATHRLSITQRLSVLRLSSIRNKILMLAVLGTLLPSLTTTWFSYIENKHSLQAKASEELLSVSAQTARELDLWAKERRYDLRVFSSSYEVTENVERIRGAERRALPEERLSDYLNSVRERFADYHELLIVDPQGQVVAAGGKKPDSLSLPEDWQSQMRGHDVVMGPPYWNAEAEHMEMLVAVPITVAGGRFIGALVAEVDLGSLSTTLSRFVPGESGQVYLIDLEGNYIVGSRGGDRATMGLQYAAGVTSSFASREGKPLEFTNIFQQHVVGSMRPVPGLNWTVVAEIPSDEVFSQLARLRNVTLLIVLGMLALAGGLGYALGLFIVRPLDVLTRGAAKVAGGDLDVDLPVAKGGEVAYLTEVFNNMVARLRASRSELERLSVTDDLTGLNNRRRMMEALHNEVRRSRRLKHSFAILMADVDHFKLYNDEHGHPAGDDVLMRVAAVVGESTRDVDFVARYGGEEFFVLMPEVASQAAVDMAHKIRQRLSLEVFQGGKITLSFGVAEFPMDGASGESLIAVADAALYQAKRQGRDQVVVGGAPERAKAAGI
jgi:diguanylate cyclase (GGDEF)-like protein